MNRKCTVKTVVDSFGTWMIHYKLEYHQAASQCRSSSSQGNHLYPGTAISVMRNLQVQSDNNLRKTQNCLILFNSLFGSQQYCLSCRGWDSLGDPLGHKVALVVIVSQFCLHAYCLSLGFSSSNSRTKKKKKKKSMQTVLLYRSCLTGSQRQCWGCA